MSFITTQSGKQIHFLKPLPDDQIDIEDIAHSLSMQCRWVGHCPQFYSVAEHSIIVANNMRRVAGVSFNGKQSWVECMLVALLHDAAETYISDIPRPLKRNLPAVKKIEDLILSKVYSKFLWFDYKPYWEIVMESDFIWLQLEYKQFFGKPLYSDLSIGVNGEIKHLSPVLAKKKFLTTFNLLMGLRPGKNDNC